MSPSERTDVHCFQSVKHSVFCNWLNHAIAKAKTSCCPSPNPNLTECVKNCSDIKILTVAPRALKVVQKSTLLGLHDPFSNPTVLPKRKNVSFQSTDLRKSPDCDPASRLIRAEHPWEVLCIPCVWRQTFWCVSTRPLRRDWLGKNRIKKTLEKL